VSVEHHCDLVGDHDVEPSGRDRRGHRPRSRRDVDTAESRTSSPPARLYSRATAVASPGRMSRVPKPPRKGGPIQPATPRIAAMATAITNVSTRRGD
jgi:hypothetical protein